MKWQLGCLALLLACACSGGDGEPPAMNAQSDWSKLPEVHEREPELKMLPTRDEQYAKLCGLGRDDSFVRAICATPRPQITDMAALLRVTGLEQDRAFALTGNSTSLVKSAVSAVNPRAIVFPRVDEQREKPAELTALGFARGEPFVEVVSRDSSGDYNFYLFTFERECDYAGGCDLASLLTEELERGWTAFSIYTEEDVENTSLDCRSCHQPQGFGTPKILRMQELESPWLHWFPQRFVQRTSSDVVLTAQFLEAHAVDGAYAGIRIATIGAAVDEGSGAQLEALLVAEGQDIQQPNVFDPRIEAEAKDGQASPTWEAQFAISLAGDSIGVPYPLADVTDAELRASSVKSYVDVVSGVAPRESLLDLRYLFTDDAKQKLGLVPPPAADGLTVLTQHCSRCHDGRSNPGVSRSSFNVKALAEMSREEKDLAISRMQEPDGSPGKMPPWRASTLPPEALAAAIAELQK